MKYSIDTCSLVETFRRKYPPRVLPSLWSQHLPALIASGNLRATQEVCVEIERQDDEVLAWVKDQADLFVELDDAVQLAVKDILKSHRGLIDPKAGRSGADPFVIALAQTTGSTVVTEEGHGKLTKPRIPDVCKDLGVPCISLIEMMVEQGWAFR